MTDNSGLAMTVNDKLTCKANVISIRYVPNPWGSYDLNAMDVAVPMHL